MGQGTPVALSGLAPKNMRKSLGWNWVRGKLKHAWSFPSGKKMGSFQDSPRVTVEGQTLQELGRRGSPGREVQGEGRGPPVFELHHLLLPRTQAPSLGVDGENAIVLHAHLVQFCVVKLCLLCPQLQVDLLVTWKEEGPGRSGGNQGE